MGTNKIERKEKYRRLREVGFSSKSANILKDMSIATVETLISLRHKYNDDKKELWRNAPNQD
jgi:hypothetical protein